ncbi:MAG: hypothetical protein ACXVED_16230 [Bacteroidia bacterium]
MMKELFKIISDIFYPEARNIAEGNLLEVFEHEQLISRLIRKEFYVLKNTATLADAMTLITLQNPTDIIIVDDNEKFLKTINVYSILRQFPPSVQSIPKQYHLKYRQFFKSLNANIESVSHKSIQSITEFENVFTYQSTSIKESIEKLIVSKNETIPVLKDDGTVIGTFTCKSFFEYLQLSKLSLNAQLNSIKPKYNSTILPPDTGLCIANFIVDYLPIDYVMVGTKSNIMGVINYQAIKIKTSEIYEELYNASIIELFKNDLNITSISAFDKISKAIDFFIENDKKFVLIHNFDENNIITQKDILEFFIKCGD